MMGLNAVGAVDPAATTATIPGAADLVLPPGKVSLIDVTTPPRAFLVIGGAILAGAVVGGLSDDDWRGAFVGAGSMSALVAGYSLVTAWASTEPGARIILGVGGGLSAAIAAGVYLRRRRTRR